MDDPVAQAILNQYFRRLELALNGLSVERREQIVDDLRTHVQECLLAEPKHSDATVMAILDRVGDPEEIAREALRDESAHSAFSSSQPTGNAAAARHFPSALRRNWRLTAPGVVLLLAAVVVVIVLNASGSSASSAIHSQTRVNGRLVAARTATPVLKNGWLPGSDVSGDHHSPGASDCTPQTLTGSESAATLEASANEVESGTVDGHSWSVWSKTGHSGADGLERGGVVVDGVAHGLCPGFANPAEMELLEPSGGGDGLAYGVVGYAGTAKVDIYGDRFGNFATGTLLGSSTAQKVNGVGFFITSLSQSACSVPAVEMNTASASYAAEHNLGFSTKDCTDGQLVPISDSQGIWQLPTRNFPDKFNTFNGGGGSVDRPTVTRPSKRRS
jgi:hypothetical protein